jgi:hypothetical protein
MLARRSTRMVIMEACRMLYIGTVTASTNHASYPCQRVAPVTTTAVAATSLNGGYWADAVPRSASATSPCS